MESFKQAALNLSIEIYPKASSDIGLKYYSMYAIIYQLQSEQDHPTRIHGGYW